jgi:ketosteroid isomerase-like protein
MTEAFTAMISHGDLEAIVSLFNDSSTLEEPKIFPYGGIYRGRDKVRAGFLNMMSYWDDLAYVMPRMIDGGNTIVTRLPFSARSKATGKAVKLDVVEFWEFDDTDQLVGVTVLYSDTNQVLDALRTVAA